MPDNSWKTGFYASLLKYVQQQGYPDAVEVTSLYDNYRYGGCDACGSDGIEVKIRFKTAGSDRIQVYTYAGRLSYLIADLSE